jgi:SOUL heme-binding protein
MTKRQEYKVLREYENFEIREYQPCILAEVKVSADYSSATSDAFGRLFQYISKGNKSAEKIAMTAPVIAARKDSDEQSNEWFVSFVMPSGSKFGHLPHPNNPQVKLRELDSEICIALSFRGKATKALSDEKVRQLREAAKEENISMSDETRICRFDPPFKPGFMQYNEIVIPIFLSLD